MRKVGFYIGHGVEVRYFLLSGISAALLARDIEVCLILRPEIQSDALQKYVDQYKVKVLRTDISEKEVKPAPFEKYIRAVRNARKRYLNIPLYSHFGGNIGRKRSFDFVLGNALVSRLFDRISRFVLKVHYKNQKVQDFFLKHNITDLYLLEYNNPVIKTLGFNANILGIKSFISLNTLKTVFIDDFIPFYPSKVFAWNDEQRALYIDANPSLRESAITTSGSLYHAFLQENESPATHHSILHKYRLPPGRKIILYSLIFEKVYTREHLIIEQIMKVLESVFTPQDCPVLIVRRNPFEENQDHVNYIRNLKNVVVADHYWERNSEKSWSIQAPEGEEEWRCFLQRADICMNIPSMSTIDALMCGTPVINVGFDEEGGENNIIPHIINAPFVEEFEKSQFVYKYRTIQEFRLDIKSLLDLKTANRYVDIRSSIDIAHPNLNNF